ncbi:MAG: AAA domain-containing protein [Candidatus Latescibacteria bacterium]|nr:AAA domain-containing protein [Candidatus Latescibacterota bacterium]
MSSTTTALLSFKGTWRTYTTTDGLASLKVEHIAEDRDGCLWFATVAGVSRFDGDTFRTFTKNDGLPDNGVQTVLEDSQGRIWCGTQKGVCWYDGETWHPFDLGDDAFISFMCEDSQGRLWVGGFNVIGYIEGTAYCDLRPLASAAYAPQGKDNDLFGTGPYGECWGIAEDSKGRVWLGFNQPWLWCYDGTAFTHFDLETAQSPGQSTTVATVATDAEGTLWVGRADRVWRHIDDSFQPMPLSLQEDMAHIRKLQFDRHGRLWISTVFNGLCCFDGQTTHYLEAGGGLPSQTINGVCLDREDNLWCAAWGGGVARFDMGAQRLFGQADGLPNCGIDRLLEERGGRLWMILGGFIGLSDSVSLDKTVANYDGETFSIFTADQLLHRCQVGTLCLDGDGRIWFGGSPPPPGTEKSRQARLTCLDPQSMQPLTEVAASVGEKCTTAITRRQSGELVLALLSEEILQRDPTDPHLPVVQYDGKGTTTLFEIEWKPLSIYISALIEDGDGGFYFATKGGTFQGEGQGVGIGHWTPAQGVRRYTEADGLADDRATDLALDPQGRLWISTLGGLSCFDGSSFRNFTLADGLPSERIYCICLDRRDTLWLGTEAGVVHSDGTLFQTLHSPHISLVTSIIEDQQGQFWIGTPSGLVHYRPGTEAPRIRLLQLEADQIYPAADEIEITAQNRQVVFEFKGLSFRTHPRNLLYTWRLEGFDANWQPASNARRVYYNDLPPGDYTFHVKAIDFDLNESEPATLTLKILPDPRLEALNATLKTNGRTEEFLGQSPSLAQVQQQLAQVGATDMTVLIFGETGTGKGVAARALHRLSQRKGPIIQINCGAIPDGLVESELFGHEKGAFTGADQRQLGRVELAQDGTLFLDEIGDLPLDAQVKLLRLLEERAYERIGSSRTLESDTRFVAATNRDLEEMVEEGSFRQDLYYRLRTFVVNLPPLRQRQEDIALLAHFFTEGFAAHLSRPAPTISPVALTQLKAYDWPGNVRELEHLMQRATLLCRDDCIEMEDLGLDRPGDKAVEDEGLFLPLVEYEKRYIERALEATDGVIFGDQGAAKLLDINPQTLRSRMRKHGIRRPEA